MRLRPANRRFGAAAFTMVEIAIAIGVIGFALVAIIGILPYGLNVQKESHQDTVINEEASFFMEAIRNGGIPGGSVSNASLTFLTNSIEQIYISTNGGRTSNNVPLTSVGAIVGALSTPEYYYIPGTLTPLQTNLVMARVRALSGNVVEQASGSLVAFRYLMNVEVFPFQSSVEAGLNPNLPNSLFEVHLKFSWPVSGVNPPFTVGPGRAHYRSMVAGQMLSYTNNSGEIFWSMQPYAFSTNTTLGL